MYSAPGVAIDYVGRPGSILLNTGKDVEIGVLTRLGSYMLILLNHYWVDA
jgi:hypothetical protein